jgi:hypothetical protein
LGNLIKARSTCRRVEKGRGRGRGEGQEEEEGVEVGK